MVGREIDIAVLRRSGRRAASCPRRSRSWSTASSTTTTKYGGVVPTSGCPAALADADTKEVADAALAIFDALDCAGVARVDFFLTDDGLVLNEVNTMPGFTEPSQAPRMFAAAGLSLPRAARTCWSRTPCRRIGPAARDSIADMNERLHEWALELYFVGAVFSVGVIAVCAGRRRLPAGCPIWWCSAGCC